MRQYIDAEKLISEIERRLKSLREWKIGWERKLPLVRSRTYYKNFGKESAYDAILNIIDSLQQEQPEGNLEYWLEHFGMPKENIDYCITQIAQGYGACRYLEGIQHGAEAINELAKQEQPEVDFEKEINRYFEPIHVADIQFEPFTQMAKCARHFYELGRLSNK